MTKLERIKAIREGGHTLRCHTTPHIGEYSVASHSWHVATLLLAVWPHKQPPSFNLMSAILHHDVAERWVGDMPAPAKWYGRPALAEEYELAEEKVFENLGLSDHLNLNKEERWWLSVADRCELLLWCFDQHLLGNRHSLNMVDRLKEFWSERVEHMPDPVYEAFKSLFFIHPDDWSRGEELLFNA